MYPNILLDSAKQWAPQKATTPKTYPTQPLVGNLAPKPFVPTATSPIAKATVPQSNTPLIGMLAPKASSSISSTGFGLGGTTTPTTNSPVSSLVQNNQPIKPTTTGLVNSVGSSNNPNANYFQAGQGGNPTGTTVPVPQVQQIQQTAPTPPVPQQTEPTQQTQKTDYPSLVQGLANQGNSPYNQRLTSATDAAGNLANTNPGNSGPAFDAYQKAINDLTQFKQSLQDKQTDIYNTPVALDVQVGREANLQNRNSAYLDLLQQKVNEAQAGLGYQISGQQTQNQGYSTAGGLATGGQGMAQGALGTAAGLTPEALRYGEGGIGTAGNVQGRLQMSQALPQQKASLATTNGLKDSIQSLISSSNLNPSDFTDINAITQFLNGKVANPQYQALSNAVSQYVQTIAPILGMDVNTIAANIKGNGGSIGDTINNLQQLAQYKVAQNEAMVNGTAQPQAPTNTFSSGTGSSSNDPAGIR